MELILLHVLVLVMITVDGLYTEHVGTYNSMQKCFEQRELVVEELGRPIVGYQAICIQAPVKEM